MKRKITYFFLPGLLLLILTSISLSCPPPEPMEVSFTIDGSNTLRSVISGHILGGNVGAWANDGDLSAPAPEYAAALSPGIYRFPGGNISNNFCWVDQKVSDNDHIDWADWSWGTDVDEFILFLDEIGSVPMFSVNPFDHTIDTVFHSAVNEAELLVEHFSDAGYPGGYYELGNENDGSWNPMLSITEYTDRFIEFAGAMKTIDPTIKMMGPVGSGFDEEWIGGFLEGLDAQGKLSLLDYVSFHHYGGWISNDNSNPINLDDPQGLESMIAYIRNKCASLGEPGIKTAVTEFNAAIWNEGCDRGKFTIEQGLWLADFTGMLFLHADMGNVWINIHPGSDPHSLIDTESNPVTRTKNYWPYYCAAKALCGITPEENVSILDIDTGISTGIITAYGVKKSDDSIGILLINKTGSTIQCEINLANITAGTPAQIYTLDEGNYEQNNGPVESTASIDGTVLNLQLPGLSVKTVLIE